MPDPVDVLIAGDAPIPAHAHPGDAGADLTAAEAVRLEPGQRATVYVLSAPRRPVHGTIDSLGWGVSPDEGVTLGGLPRVPRSLSWVRIAQRFPVRILLDHPPPELMRVGASAVIVVER